MSQTDPLPDRPSGVQIVEAGLGKGWPRVAGVCPACGSRSLFVASGGYVTCAIRGCSDPTAVSDLLDPAEGQKISHGRHCTCSARAPQPSQSTEHCEYERDSAFSWCLAPWRFTVARADGDQTYSGGRESGVYRCCEAHLANAVAGMADGDDMALTVTIRYDTEAR